MQFPAETLFLLLDLLKTRKLQYSEEILKNYPKLFQVQKWQL